VSVRPERVSIGRRWVRFNAAGAAGVGVQLATLWLLTSGWHVHHLIATAIAVGAAVVHNFVWHWKWTWRERALAGRGVGGAFRRFVVANGVVSIAGNLAIAAALVDFGGLPPVGANAIAIAVCGLVNFWVADSVVFVSRCEAPSADRRGTRATPAPAPRQDSRPAMPLSLP
jgi:putative flippase GtrA